MEIDLAATVFFSWQADRTTRVCRNLLEKALGTAINRLGDKAHLEEADRNELVLDRDTKDVPGFPPIVETIFKKIDAAAVFVPDFTFVGTRSDGRPTPNPNVLIEYGWALKALGHGRIVPVMNTAFGEPSDATLPFDLRHQRHPITYHCPTDADDATRKSVRERLSQDLERALRLVVSSDDYLNSLPQPIAPEPFQPAPEISHGRFRSINDPIGIGEHFPAQSSEIRLADRSLMWLRVIPKHRLEKIWTISDVRTAGTAPQSHLRPLWDGYSGLSYLRAPDGFGVYACGGDDDESTASAVTFAFKSGEIWAIDALYLDMVLDRGFAAIPDIEPDYARSLRSLGEYLTRLGVDAPYRWIAGMTGLRGRGLEVPVRTGFASPYGPKGRCMLDVVSEQGIYTPGQSPVEALKPFFSALYESCALSRPDWLDHRPV
ncbi:hypothetical protein [Ralstonia holmesii]|uniref:hypothetical protein n=1 Tax=Ralstonia holmesii TaxID=3058602 RepID=UPI003D65EB7F